ncbi:hypothetical protein NDU88_003063 [Pleurodeles waltl]|uniref:Uncharacterized protein n=1 Tax=Pleurodeles waltl TaxID=8319 RepID=A0AAV7SF26_PLEWA|nr:hypothetical protein NDU88_003063 [Pleurodeles waltl]
MAHSHYHYKQNTATAECPVKLPLEKRFLKWKCNHLGGGTLDAQVDTHAVHTDRGQYQLPTPILVVILTSAVKGAYRRSEILHNPAAVAETRHGHSDPQKANLRKSDRQTSGRRKGGGDQTSTATPTEIRPCHYDPRIHAAVIQTRYSIGGTHRRGQNTHKRTKLTHIGRFESHTPDTHTHTTPTHTIQYKTPTHITHKPLRLKFHKEDKSETPASKT